MKSMIIVSLLFIQSLVAAAQYDPCLKLWYNTPATIWEEALPLGNGKTGAMVFGNVQKERFQLNDNTLWSGFPEAGNNPNGPTVLPQVREAVFNGDFELAAKLWKKMQGPYSARYLPLGDLWLTFDHKDSVTQKYHRELDLNRAISTVRYTKEGVEYTRETFTSFPAKAMVVRLTANKKAALNFSVDLSSKLRFTTKAVAANLLVLKGKAPKFVANRPYEPKQVEYDDEKGEGMTFEIQVKVVNEGGKINATGNQLIVSNANSVTIYLTEATSFNGFNRSAALQGKNPCIEAMSRMGKVSSIPYELLKNAHVADHQSLFNRVQLNLGTDEESLKLPTDLRLKTFSKRGGDNALVSLYYQFGRYLMIAASRPGSRPTNLQGIWNDHVQPPWGSNYTTNINTEMNYWLAENANLSECHQPLFDFMKELAVNGAITAKVNYNIGEGWVVHHNSDLWAKTSPPGGYEWDEKGMPRWSCWPMAAVWFATHCWEHYLFTGDVKFLREQAYPLMKGAAQFQLQWLVRDPASNYLVTNPSTSPENTLKKDGKEFQLSMASTMDMSLLRELFTALISAADLLKIDADFRAKLENAKAQLYPYHIGQYGQLQEWFKDWDQPSDKHRHLSHLFGLYPGSQITVLKTPELAAAARQSLIHRGDMSTGWSMAWKVNWWARLQDGEHAYKILSDAFAYINPREDRETMGGGGTYPNLFDAHPPFQIDGNFGATAGITEMLLQSHDGRISLLPALPAAWPAGSVRGIKARGNFTVSIYWKEQQLVKASIYSGSGGNCRIRTNIPVRVVEVNARPASGNNTNRLNTSYGIPPYEVVNKAAITPLPACVEYVIDFNTVKGKTYTILPK